MCNVIDSEDIRNNVLGGSSTVSEICTDFVEKNTVIILSKILTKLR